MTADLAPDFSVRDLRGFMPYVEAFLADPKAQALFALRHGTTDSKLVL